ncbi:serine hydrolase [Vagococcus zengguangii]|uniref:hypothetical protein n=1 Tax=Vagococcus zengguangii TaxID=2571750 RepID=UPI001286A614|nr:hypothetical protein [Vagococcus zengguangii]TLG79644.1 serine hydrolase [Vagococcus zengguangii]
MKRKIINSKTLLVVFMSLMTIFVVIFYRRPTPTIVSQNIERAEMLSQAKQLIDIEKLNKELNEKKVDKERSQQLTKTLQDAWKTLLKNETTKFDIAIYDNRTDIYVTYSNKPIPHFYTASIAKVAVLMEVLALDEKGIAGLSTQEQRDAELMITKSNNEVTHKFVKSRLGDYLEIDHLFAALNMSDTQANKESWGLIQTDALDQVKLINAIFGEQPYNRQQDVTYIQQLMSRVDEEQQWGISKNANRYYLKNGWLSLDGKTWLVNSIGKVADQNADYSIAVLTEGNQTFTEGIKLIEKIAGETYKQIEQLTIKD